MLKHSLATAGLVPRIQFAEDLAFPRIINAINLSMINRSLIANSISNPRDGINIVFTSFRGSLDGISFGLPSPLPRDGFVGGVLVGFPMDRMMINLPEDTLELKFNKSGNVAAHELGHYLGLFHVCEVGSRLAEDGLYDTQCERNTNLMMHGADFAPFSAQQRAVMLGNPAIELLK